MERPALPRASRCSRTLVCLLASAPAKPCVLHPQGLAGGELVVATVVRVIHVVVDRIDAGLAARVLTHRAAVRRDRLRRRVLDVIAPVVAGAVEDVVQVEPVTGL